ncbi:hypothetical protein ASPVEDRAFT_80713 [Aspergillus versicolor CBS 583.65]|uniref:Uncharacterized protein n=1 Tax=Aspergillus versicolor CBS 583.65 TaxID=1036611 RepID=A0A1L9PC52_ASPVE|nr:uncharacterized protein ASPVEDRAFT_80713 [Aspergillus versicolor CBS 583.65]OJI99086.1 hypothetical protein ASPVEDRAFT_80713 [Aspergillus versicolor CBS 583.65]
MSLRDELSAIESPPFSESEESESDEQSEDGTSESEDGKYGLGGQIKEIIQALNDIRSQLAEQNKYLDVLTEKYIARPAQITFTEDEWDTETDEEMWEDTLEPIEEHELQALDEVNVASAREWTKEARLAEAGSAQHRYILGFTVATVFYLPMGLITSFFGMHLFKSDVTMETSQTSFIPVFLILSLTTYVFAACALWLVRDGDKIKKMLNSWSPTDTGQTSQRPSNLRLPNLMRRRKAWEAAL